MDGTKECIYIDTFENKKGNIECEKSTMDESRVRDILALDFYVQRSPQWYQLREKKITASEAGSIISKSDLYCAEYIREFSLVSESSFSVSKKERKELFIKDKDELRRKIQYELDMKSGSKHLLFKTDSRKSCNPYSTQKDLLDKKQGKTTFNGNKFTLHGTRLEEIACRLYSRFMGKNVKETGFLIHKDHDWLGASPDGMTMCGRMIEIKVPYHRVPTGIPPIHYWIQMQLQMECCDISVCDFIDCIIDEIQYSEYEESKQNGQVVGMFLILEKDGSESYIYPSKCTESVEEQEKDILERKERVPLSHYDSIRFFYWKMRFMYITPVKRNRVWFDMTRKEMYAFWKKAYEPETETGPQQKITDFF